MPGERPPRGNRRPRRARRCPARHGGPSAPLLAARGAHLCRPRASSPYAKVAAHKHRVRLSYSTNVRLQTAVIRNPVYSTEYKKARRPALLALVEQCRRSAVGPRSVQTAAIARHVWGSKDFTSGAARPGPGGVPAYKRAAPSPAVRSSASTAAVQPSHSRQGSNGARHEGSAPRPPERFPSATSRAAAAGDFRPFSHACRERGRRSPRTDPARNPAPSPRRDRPAASPLSAPPEASQPPARYLLAPKVRGALRSRRVVPGPGAGRGNNGHGNNGRSNGLGTCPHSAQAQHVQRRAGRAERTAAAP